MNAVVVDGRGKIVIPGLVNAHMHTWQTALRGVASNWTLLEDFKNMHAGLATVFRPEEPGHRDALSAPSTRLTAAPPRSWTGATTTRTPADNDAAIDALQESGASAPRSSTAPPKPNPKPGQPGFWEVPHPRTELERLRKHRVGGLVSLGAAILGPHYSTMEVSRHDFEMARDLGLIASMHQGGGPPRTPDGWPTLEREGLLGPDINIVHGNDLSDDQPARLRRRHDLFDCAGERDDPGARVSHYRPPAPLGRVRLGIDLESVISARCSPRLESRSARSERSTTLNRANGPEPFPRPRRLPLARPSHGSLSKARAC